MIPANIDQYYKLHSKFYDTTRWAFLFGRTSLKKLFPVLPENPTILDLGCGTGKQLIALQKKYPLAKIIGLDRSSEMLDRIYSKLEETIELRNEIYSKESFTEESFDLIIASYSLTMIDHFEKTLSIIQTHLKPGGVFLVVDFDSSPFPWFINWMKKNYVQMSPSLFKVLKERFPESEIKTKKAYFGLYSYSFFSSNQLK